MTKHVNQSHSDGHEKSSEPLIPFRYFVMFLVFMATAIEYSARCVLNVAILAMVGTKGETNNNRPSHLDDESSKVSLIDPSTILDVILCEVRNLIS